MKFKNLLLIVVALLVISTGFIVSCKSETSGRGDGPALQLYSKSFAMGDSIPYIHTCLSNPQISPGIYWDGGEGNIESYVILMDDPDAVPVAGYIWNHWGLYDIPKNIRELKEGASAALNPAILKAKNSFGNTAYGGPCPPAGQTHTYHFRLFSLDVASLGIADGAEFAAIRQAMTGHVLDSTEYTGTFRR